MLDRLPIFLDERLQFVALLGVLFAQPDHFSDDSNIEAIALGLQINFLLCLGQLLDLIFKVLNALNDGSKLIARTLVSAGLGGLLTRYGSATE